MPEEKTTPEQNAVPTAAPAEKTTAELVAAKCLELAEKYKVPKVHAYIGRNTDTDEPVVAYVKEPNFETKLHLLDKAAIIGPHQAANELRTMCLLKEESHPLTYGDTPNCDKYKLGVVTMCLDIVRIVETEVKKN